MKFNVELTIPSVVVGELVKIEHGLVYCKVGDERIYVRPINEVTLLDSGDVVDHKEEVILPPKSTNTLTSGLNITPGKLVVDNQDKLEDDEEISVELEVDDINNEEEDLVERYNVSDITPATEAYKQSLLYADDPNYTAFLELSKKYGDTVSLFQEEYYEYYKMNKPTMQLHRVLMHEPYANNSNNSVDVSDKVNALWDRFDIYQTKGNTICTKLENIRHLAYILLLSCRSNYEKYTINNGFYNFYETELFASTEYTKLKDIYIDVWDSVATNLLSHKDNVLFNLLDSDTCGLVIYHKGYKVSIGTSIELPEKVDTKGSCIDLTEVSTNYDVDSMSNQSNVKFSTIELPFEPGSKEDLEAIEDLYNAHLISKDTRKEVTPDEQEHLNKLLDYAQTANVVNKELSKAYGSFSVPIDVIKNALDIDKFNESLSDNEKEDLDNILKKYNNGESIGWSRHTFLEKAKANVTGE